MAVTNTPPALIADNIASVRARILVRATLLNYSSLPLTGNLETLVHLIPVQAARGPLGFDQRAVFIPTSEFSLTPLESARSGARPDQQHDRDDDQANCPGEFIHRVRSRVTCLTLELSCKAFK